MRQSRFAVCIMSLLSLSFAASHAAAQPQPDAPAAAVTSPADVATQAFNDFFDALFVAKDKEKVRALVSDKSEDGPAAIDQVVTRVFERVADGYPRPEVRASAVSGQLAAVVMSYRNPQGELRYDNLMLINDGGWKVLPGDPADAVLAPNAKALRAWGDAQRERLRGDAGPATAPAQSPAPNR
jgi:hypothetical protein